MGKLSQSETEIGRAASFETPKPKFHCFSVIVPVFHLCLHMSQHNEPLNMTRIIGCNYFE